MRNLASMWLVVVLLLGTVAYVLAEDLTLSTYYPSPRGVYKELAVETATVSEQLAVNGNTILGNASTDLLTFNASTLAIPNGLIADGGTFAIDAANNSVLIAPTASTATPTLAVNRAGVGIIAQFSVGGSDSLNLSRESGQWTIQPQGNNQRVYFSPTAPYLLSVEMDGNVSIIGGSLQIQDGTQASGRVLTSVDALGQTAWQTKTLSCITVTSNGKTAACPAGFTVTGCGTFSSGEDDQVSGNGCFNNESGVWAQCCQFQ